jgi:hypothetical protein
MRVSVSLTTLEQLLRAAEEVADSYLPCGDETPPALDDAIEEARAIIHGPKQEMRL